MTERWERRVRSALFSQRGVPLRVRASAGVMLLGMRFGRRRPRVLRQVMAVVMTAIVATVVLTTLAFNALLSLVS